MITRIFIASILLTSIVIPAPAVHADENRPKVGLVLSGGGARGGAHVGILKALEQLQVPIDYIAGTSMGAIIGALYAAGYSAAEVEAILLDTDWQRGLTDTPERKYRTMRKKELDAQFLIPYRVGFNNGKVQLPLGAISGQHLDQMFQELLFPVVGIQDFSMLPIPFRAVATDLATGEAVILSEGSLADSVRASMSVPGVFSPVRLNGRLLVDGGMANNLPVNVVREMGADIVIAVDISSPLLEENQLTSVVSVTEQLSNFLTRRSTEEQIRLLSENDLLIVPALGNFGAADFENVADIVSVGEDAVLAESGKLLAMVETTGAADPPAGVQGQQASDYVVQFIEIENDSVLNDELIRSRLPLEPGDVLNPAALNRSLDEIYSLDVFEVVSYDLEENEAGESGLRIKAVPRHWGPNYFQLGVELSSDFSGTADFKLGAAYTRNALNALGGELRVLASLGREDELSFDFYQPIDPEARWFVQPVAYWQRENYELWDGDVNVATLEISGWGAELGVGRNFSTTKRVKLTYEYAQAEASVLTGAAGFPIDGDIDIGELDLTYVHDSLDSNWFPTKGGSVQIGYTYADSSLGASTDYEQAFSRGAFAFTRGRNTALLNYELGYSFDDAAPVERWYRLGGFARLSGYAPNQLIGRHLAMFNLAGYRQLANNQLVTLYTGFTLEAGNVWEFSDDMGFDDLQYAASLYFGADTPIGPVYLSLGHNDSGDTAVYFYVGNPFRVSRFD